MDLTKNKTKTYRNSDKNRITNHTQMIQILIIYNTQNLPKTHETINKKQTDK